MVRNKHMFSTYELVDIGLFTIIKSIKHKQTNNKILDYFYYTKTINILIYPVLQQYDYTNTGIYWGSSVACYKPSRKQYDSTFSKKHKSRVYNLDFST